MNLIAKLREENEALKARIKILENAFRADIRIPAKFGLTPRQSEIFQYLLARDVATRQHLYAMLDRDHVYSKDAVNVHICHIRRKLEPFGIEIKSLTGIGYQVVNRRQVLEMLQSD